MNQRYQGYGFDSSNVVDVRVRNQVLRNTYWLLTLSLLPTILGAWIGIATGFSLFASSPILSLIAFFGISFGFIYGIERNKNSGMGVALLLGFTFFMGLLLSRLVGHVLGFSNGASLIMLAFGGTALIFTVMASIATVSKRDFSGMSRWLTMGVLVLIVASIANIWLQLPALVLTVSTLAIAIFSGFLLYDIQRVVNSGETNYITATLAIYLDLYNIFVNLLSILSIFGGNRNN